MRVLYDGVIYRIQKYGGVVRYFNGLIHNLPERLHPILLAPNRPAVPPCHPNLSTHIETCGPLLWPIKPLRKKIIAQRTCQRMKTENPDVLHPTYYYSSLRHLSGEIQIPTVLTVYDLIHERFPAQMDPYGKQVRLKKSALSRADAVICISESTRRDLQKYYNVPDERITVIHLGSDFQPLENVPVSTDSQPYLLYVGERNFYKNFERSLTAFANAAASRPDIRLRCIGGKPFSKTEQEQIASLGLPGRVTHEGYLEDSAMKSIYTDARAVIYPSLYEGFGIPILEGMSCGTAVLTSNRASMPEVAGNAALIFDPYSIDEITASIERVFDSESAREELIRKGLQRAGEFSWQESARKTVEVYRSVAARRLEDAA